MGHMRQGERFDGMGHAGGWWWLGGLLWVILIAAIVTAAVVIGIRLVRRAGPGIPPAGPTGARPLDPAAAELRLRYARGEVSREEYLQRAADLGVPVAPDDATARSAPQP